MDILHQYTVPLLWPSSIKNKYRHTPSYNLGDPGHLHMGMSMLTVPLITNTIVRIEKPRVFLEGFLFMIIFTLIHNKNK